MPISDYLTPERTLILPACSRDQAIEKLVSTICTEESGLSSIEVFSRIMDREDQLTSRLEADIALPHAVFEDYRSSLLALGLSRDGIAWDPTTEEKVHLVFLLAGGRKDHLQVLSDISLYLRQHGVKERLKAARDSKELYSIISREARKSTVQVSDKNRDISRLSLEQALFITRQLDNARLVVYADAVGEEVVLGDLKEDPNLLIVSGGRLQFPKELDLREKLIHVPFLSTNRAAAIQFTLLFLLSQGLIERDEVIVHLFGLPGSGYFDTIRLSYVEHELRISDFINSGAANFYDQHVFTRVLQLANELASEGREGKALGTLFVYGDYEEIKPYSRQMIINPFGGMPFENRNILDPGLEETIKEYAKIDGAFIIGKDGTIMSAGTYISGIPESGELQSGLGARHAAALGITGVTKAFSVALSESTRKVSLFQGGKRIMVL